MEMLVAIILTALTLATSIYTLEKEETQRSFVGFFVFVLALTFLLAHCGLLVLALVILSVGAGSLLLLAALFTFSGEEKSRDVKAALVAIAVALILMYSIRIRPLYRAPLSLSPLLIPFILVHGLFIVALAVSIRLILREGEAE
ncbi:MAG: hypothetical protein DRJ51_00170 [Thermoprotei archaeon]|nr:MAG: hypothetical protein DRJ51_00170 [Thermoprotei archaeon]RLF01731.1 MAG: hypothetical protein DRJ59_05395 [Thermoprotei archaeon]